VGTVRRSIAANVTGRAFGVVAVILFVPLYLKLLGAEAYGLVGFYGTLLGVLAFADMGLTATLTREMARLSACKDSTLQKADLLRTYESLYAGVSLMLALLVWCLAPIIANHWLQNSTVDLRQIILALRIMGISIAIQLPAQLYSGGLMGLQRQVLANSLQIGWGIVRGAGAILILWLLSPTVVAFAWWQLFANAVYCVCVRAAIWHAVSSVTIRSRFQWLVLRNTWRYAAGMVGMACLSSLLMQSDKLAVSKMLPLETFGYYMLAVALAGVPRMLSSPIGAGVFPRFTGLVTAGDRPALTRLYNHASALVALAVIPGALTLAVFSRDFLFLWTGNAFAAQQVALTTTLLILGEAIQSLQVLPYLLSLAHGSVKLNLQINVVSVIVITPLLIFLITKYGVVGAGISWLVMNLCTCVPFTYFIHRRFLPGELRRWFMLGVGRPLLVAAPCVLLGQCLIPMTDSRMLSLVMITLVWGVATLATVVTIPELRRVVLQETIRVLGVSHERE